MPDEVLSPAEASVADALPFDLGQWLGRHQALAWVASRCSAADAHALREIREQKLYRALGLNWEDFCRDHAGFSHKKADRIIDRLEEFGDSYFNLTEILRIPAPEYRALQPAIQENTLEFDGVPIPINRENTEQLIEAVQTLRAQLEQERDRTAPSPLMELQKFLDRAVGQISGTIRRTDGMERELLIAMVENHAQQAIEAVRQALAHT